MEPVSHAQAEKLDFCDLTKLAEAGRSPEDAAAQLRKAEGSRRAQAIEPISAADCIVIARLPPTTKAQGLSLVQGRYTRLCDGEMG